MTEPTITAPPSATHGSSGSPNAAAPSSAAQTSCRKATGCVTPIGAAAKALVIVQCPAVASPATTVSAPTWPQVTGAHTAQASGASPIVTNTDSIATTTVAETSPDRRLARM